VLGGGLDVTFPGVDPQRAQLQEARSFGATVAAILLGIPGAMLHVSTSGATITYTNPAGAVEEVTKATIAPRWLVPIERAWSRLLPSTQSVRFDLADMQRADIAGRFALYKSAIETVDPRTGEPLMTVAEARAYEGWGPTETEAGHQFDPVGEAPTPAIPAEATA
jgi:phage portal protein BeeE